MPKSDYLHVCNNHGVPIPDFEQMFCNRCLNPECSRSLAGKTKFEARTSTWYEALFESPQRMDRQDPRYPQISAQKFLDVPGAPLQVSSDWIDPRDLEPPEPPVVSPKPQKVQSASKGSSDLPLLRPEVVQDSVVPSQSPETRVQTPFKQGTVLKESAHKPVEKDPWASPTPSQNSVPIVSPGQKFRFEPEK